MVLMVANAKLSVYVLSLTVATATLSVNMLTLTVATAMLSVDHKRLQRVNVLKLRKQMLHLLNVDTNGCNCNT